MTKLIRKSLGAVCGALIFTSIPTIASADGTAPPLREWMLHPVTTRSVERHGMGYVPTDEATFDKSPHFKVTRGVDRERPHSLVLTKYLPPVANQGHQSSCVAWSSAYYCYSYAIAQKRHLSADDLKTAKWEFSPAFIYNQVKSPGGGMNLGQAFKVLREQGCATMAEMPYKDDDDATQPTDAAKARAAKFVAPATGYVFKYLQADPEAIKTFLAEAKQPFTTAIPIFSDFPGNTVAPDFVYNLSVDPIHANFRGGHSVTIVGYDDDKKAFRLLNSWGTNWGDNGFMWISEEFIKKYAMEGWAEVPGGPSTRGFVRGPVSVAPRITWEPAAKL